MGPAIDRPNAKTRLNFLIMLSENYKPPWAFIVRRGKNGGDEPRSEQRKVPRQTRVGINDLW